jgi:hypothetical protein
MADEIITVEWIATAQSMLATIQKIDSKIERQEKLMQKLSDTSKQGADAAAGSFNKLEQELRASEAALKALQIGTQEFEQQKAVVDQLRESVKLAKKQIETLDAPVIALTGSFDALQAEIKENEKALHGLKIGSAEFTRQKQKVDELRGSLKQAKKEVETIEPEVLALAGSFNRLEKEVSDNEEQLKKLRIGSAEFEKQRQKVDALKRALDNANRSLKQDAESPWPNVARGMAVAAAAGGTLYAALVKVAQAQRDIVSRGAEQAVNLDTLARKMQIQAGLTDEERQAESLKVIQQSSQAGVAAESGFQAATQLAGSGFKDPVQSGSLQTILNTMQASSFQGSPDELVSAFAEALNAYGLEKTNANLQQIAVSAQSLFKQTDFQLTELQDFAKNASVFEGANIKIDEALAGFTALREVLPAAESGTGLRNFVNKLQAGDLTKENKQNLERIGVDAGQVDFVGESLTQVLKTVKDATDKMPEADRNAALGKMFGTENVASARLLINSVPRIQELQKSQQNGDQFNTDLQTASGGMQAARNRLENQRLVDMMPNANKLQEIDMRNRELDAIVEQKQQEMVIRGGVAGAVAPILPGGAMALDVAARARDEERGGRVAISGLNAIQPGTGNLINSLLDRFTEFRDEQVKTREAIQQINKLPQQRPPQPAVRPKEAPLPAATAP